MSIYESKYFLYTIKSQKECYFVIMKIIYVLKEPCFNLQILTILLHFIYPRSGIYVLGSRITASFFAFQCHINNNTYKSSFSEDDSTKQCEHSG